VNIKSGELHFWGLKNEVKKCYLRKCQLQFATLFLQEYGWDQTVQKIRGEKKHKIKSDSIKSKFHFILFVSQKTVQGVCPHFSLRLFGQPDLLKQIVIVHDKLGLPVKPTNVCPNL
jgi:hypothetical protein